MKSFLGLSGEYMANISPGISEISKFFNVPILQEPDCRQYSKDSLLLGFSEALAAPIFLDLKSKNNPHIFVTGMSGSGKTYLMRSLICRLNLMLDCLVFVIDFTGEYRDLVLYLGEVEANSGDSRFIEKIDSGIVYFNLKSLKEAEKIQRCKSLIQKLLEKMRSRTINEEKQMFILLDEAWKVLGEDGILEAIIREGRKYNVGIILASQIIEDIEVSVLSNMATLFIFRIQNQDSLKHLSSNYNISNAMLQKIQNFSVGQCLLIHLAKNGDIDLLPIRRVFGVDIYSAFEIYFGDVKMDVIIDDFCREISNLCKQDASDLISRIRKDKSIGLSELIKELLTLNAGRYELLAYLRRLGVSDSDIADGFSMAVEGILNEDRKLFQV